MYGGISVEELKKMPFIKNPIIILFDSSYNEQRGISVAMDTIFEIVRDNKDSTFVYGTNQRFEWHVENYAYEFRIPAERLSRFSYDRRSVQQARDTFGILLSYQPKKVYIFRDNCKGQFESFINNCIDAKINVISIDCEHRISTPTKLNRRGNGSKTKFYRDIQ